MSSYKHWRKVSEDSSIIYQSKAEEIVNMPSIQKDGIIRKIRIEIKEVEVTGGSNEYMVDLAYVVGNYDDAGDFQLVQYVDGRATSYSDSNKSDLRSKITSLLTKVDYKVAQDYIERRIDEDQLEEGEEAGVVIGSHYAPERIECPSCRTIGEMTFSDGIGYRCNACGESYDTNSDRLPDEVMTKND